MSPTISRRPWLALVMAIALAVGALLAVPTAAEAAPGDFIVALSSFAFPLTTVGDTSAPINITITNVSAGTLPVGLANTAPAPSSEFGVSTTCPVSLGSGASCVVQYVFHPTSPGPVSGTASPQVDGTTYPVLLSGTGIAAFTVTLSTFTFSSTPVGDTSAPIDITITNVTAAAHAVGLANTAPAPSSEFGVSTTCPPSLGSGASCTVGYVFHPTSLGLKSGTASPQVDGTTYPIVLSGTGFDPFDVTPTALAFPDTTVGASSAPLTVTIINATPATRSLSLSGFAPAPSSEFTATSGCAATLASHASCTISYVFHPTNTSAAGGSATLSVGGVSTVVTLSGRGLAGAAAPGAAGLPATGSTFDPSVLVSALLALVLGSAMLIVTRRRNRAAGQEGPVQDRTRGIHPRTLAR